MKAFARFLRRLAFDGITRRAIDETLADREHAVQRSRSARAMQSAATAVALVRVVLSGLLRTEEERPMRDLGRELRYVIRRLARAPLFTLFAVVTLTVGIGATTAIYSVVRAALGPPPGVPHIGRIVNVSRVTPARTGPVRISLPDYEDVRQRQQSFETITAFTSTSAAFSADGQSATGYIELVDGGYFDVVGVRPAAGRLLHAADDSPDAAVVAVISERLRQQLLPDVRNAVGRVVRINGHAIQVVGVAPDDFRGLRAGGLVRTAAWVPLRAISVLFRLGTGSALGSVVSSDRTQGVVMVKGLLKPGITPQQAAAEIEHLTRQLDQTQPIFVADRRTKAPVQQARDWTALEMTGLTSEMPSDARLATGLAAAVMTAVVTVLLVVCTNLANLTLARGSARRQEHAVRLALGSSRWRLVRAFLLENAIVTAAGAAGGVALARVLLHVTTGELAVTGTIATLGIQPRVDAAVLAVSAAAAMLAILVAGLGPAFQSTRGDVRSTLSTDTAAASPRWRGRRMLIVAQVTASVVLLVITAISVQELQRQATWDAGVDLDRLAVAQINFGMQGYDAPRAYEALSAVRAALLRSPGIEGVSVATAAPVFALPGVTRLTTPDGSDSYSHVVAGSAELLHTLGIGMRHGMTWPEQAGDADAMAVVSETTARELFGTANVVGQTIRRWRDDTSVEVRIVGVAADTHGDDHRERKMIYVPLDGTMDRWTTLRGFIIARTRAEPEDFLPAIRQAVAAVDPGLAIRTSGTARALAGGSTAEFYRIATSLAGGLGTCAWILALAGLYGVLSHLVQRRRREIGVRMALGAARQDVIRMILRDGLQPVLAGVGCGLVLAIVAGLLLPPPFARMIPTIDPAALAIVPPLFVAFAGAALLACYLPARRASRVDPNVALKDL